MYHHFIHLWKLHTFISKEKCIIWTHKLPKLCGLQLFLCTVPPKFQIPITSTLLWIICSTCIYEENIALFCFVSFTPCAWIWKIVQHGLLPTFKMVILLRAWLHLIAV
uniref:Uncharacterized protein n=1 Tax=Pyxicephalus adspersus TaxID=30357 RepID=A0AAV2ZTP2_PYXAD|nr:TPA: hypothetical protein GDO54_015777 [Pyxicephalus adspersus]